MASKSPSDGSRVRRGRVRAIGVVAALLMALAGPGRFADTVFDLYQRLSPRPLAPMRVQVVEIDAESLRAIGPWPWSRYDMARLTDRIAAARPLAIGYDMIFPEGDRQAPALFARRYPELGAAGRAAVLALPSFDSNFAAALGAAPTVLARAGSAERTAEYGEHSYDDAAKLPVDARFDGALPAGVARWPQALASIPEIEETSLGHGLINGDRDADGVVRRVPAVGSLNGTANTGFAVELARIALGVETVTLVRAGDRLRRVAIGDVSIPVGSDGRFRFRFGGHLPPGAITSAADLFRRGFDPRPLAGKVVVIGVTGTGGTDVAVTPVDPQAYGLHVQAQAVDAILKRAFLVRPHRAPLAELLLGLLLAGLAILILPRMRGLAVPLAAPVLVIAAIAAGSWFAFFWWGLLLDPLPPILIPAAAGLAVLVGSFVETALAQRRLRATLVQERLGAARAAGELDAAREIQRGMLLSPDALAGLDPAIDLSAVLEPARGVGGDFYDAFRLDDGRLAFLVGDVTGKGVPAALFMALSKALARAILTGAADDPAAGFADLDEALSRDNSQDMFVTMLFGVIDGATGACDLINAGHENPIVVRADGRVEEVAMRGGPPLCVATGFAYAVEPLLLGPGDGLVVTTDGVSEALTAAGDFFERTGLFATLRALARDWHAVDATAAIALDVRHFEAGAEPSDDLTVLALRRRG